MAAEAGLGGLYLVAFVGETDVETSTHHEDGFDAALYFQFPFEETRTSWVRERLRVRGIVRGPERFSFARAFPDPPAGLRGRVIPTVCPNWDNTPRSGRRGRVALGATPERFAAHLRRAIELAAVAPPDEQIVMIKSWNEWAEGNYVEPDTEYGLARLDAIAREVHRARRDGIIVDAGTSSGVSRTRGPSGP